MRGLPLRERLDDRICHSGIKVRVVASRGSPRGSIRPCPPKGSLGGSVVQVETVALALGSDGGGFLLAADKRGDLAVVAMSSVSRWERLNRVLPVDATFIFADL